MTVPLEEVRNIYGDVLQSCNTRMTCVIYVGEKNGKVAGALEAGGWGIGVFQNKKEIDNFLMFSKLCLKDICLESEYNMYTGSGIICKISEQSNLRQRLIISGQQRNIHIGRLVPLIKKPWLCCLVSTCHKVCFEMQRQAGFDL